MSYRLSLLTEARRIKSLVRHPLLGVHALEGEFQGQPLTLLLAGDRQTLGYIRQLAFPLGCTVWRKGYVPHMSAHRLSRAGADVVVIAASRLLLSRYVEAGFILAPKMVSLKLDVYDEPDVLVAGLPKSAREDLRRGIRRMKEKGYHYETTHDDEWFDLFYHRMYKPYALNKFGDLSHLCSYAMVKHDFLRGIGVSITRGGTPVAGAVARFNGSEMIHHWKGALDGDQAIARDGASLALYYYGIQLAYLNGCKTADFGFSPPFTSDGALSYKLKWGMKVSQEDCGRMFYAISSPDRTEQGLRFLRANRFFCLKGGQFTLCSDF